MPKEDQNEEIGQSAPSPDEDHAIGTEKSEQPDFACELNALMTQSFSAAASSFVRAETENISMMRRSAHIRDADRAARLSVYLENALAVRSQRLARGQG